jgi:CheY-like chemotaxis protein
MKRILLTSSILVLVFIMYAQNGQSCGDKFLLIGRGLRYEKIYIASHPASMVIYSLKDKEAKNLEVTLQKAGHKIKDASTEQELFSLLNSGKFDLVLMDLNNAGLLSEKILQSSSKPFILPVINQSKVQNAELNRMQQPCILKYQQKNKDAIKLIDQVMDDKIKGKPMKCSWTK